MKDGGAIMDMLQKGTIKSIQTKTKEHLPDENALYLSIDFGMANQYCIDLSDGVIRGLKSKNKNGWRPGLAPPGYLNDMSKEQGRRTVIKDPVGFPLIRRAFKLLLTEKYSPNQVVDILNNDWGYKTPKRKKMGGKSLAKSRFYQIITEPYYYGKYEYPVNSGNWYEGKHPAMITYSEYEQIQKILNKKNITKPSVNKIDDDFYGIFQCAECNSALTPDKKEQTICSECKGKFSSKYNTVCPHCKTDISKMKNPTHLKYTYYKCSRKKDPNCSQTSIEFKDLSKQICEVLGKISISEKMKNWYIKYLSQINDIKKESILDVQKSFQQNLNNCQRKIDNLLGLRISPENTNGELISNNRFIEENNRLTLEKEQLNNRLNDLDSQNDQWSTNIIKTFNFACYAKYWFENGDMNNKKTVLQGLGSNLKILDKKILILLPKHLELIEKTNSSLSSIKEGFELKNFSLDNKKTGSPEPAFSSLHGW